jgi:F-type H+-transporting ATPase subunit alpha
MAQYRELESFAQFDSDLDADTKKIIERGKRVTELLKQGQYSPIRVSLQVVSIFAINNGYFDDVSVSSIGEVENEMHKHFNRTYGDLLEAIDKDWNDDIKARLENALKEFKTTYKK